MLSPAPQSRPRSSRSSSSSAARGGDCVKVALNVRPLIGKEVARGEDSAVSYPCGDLPQIRIGEDSSFTFDYVFRQRTPQKHIYETAVAPLVRQFLDGYNATVIAYGQTGSGKTYTMGTQGCDDCKLQDEWGVIPSAIFHIVNALASRKQCTSVTDTSEAKDQSDVDDDFQLQVSFIEIYKEEINDLLDPDSCKRLQIRELAESTSRIHIPGLKLEPAHSALDMLEALDRGGAARATAYTKMNAQSSRSHAVFTIHLHQVRVRGEAVAGDRADDGKEVLKSKFHFVDLAGSERVKKTAAAGKRLAEGISINCGLLALGNVISALGDPRLKSKHVPFRDSKITRLLQDSLGGNARTLMVACVSPAASNMLESKNTLRYANRAKNIQNVAVVNRDPRSRQILDLKDRVKELERKLAVAGGSSVVAAGHSLVDDWKEEQSTGEQMLALSEENTQLKMDLSELKEEFNSLQQKSKELRLRLSETRDELTDARSQRMAGRLEMKKVMGRFKELLPDEDLSQLCLSSFEKETVHNLAELRSENEKLRLRLVSREREVRRDKVVIHNIHSQFARIVRGDSLASANEIDIMHDGTGAGLLLLADDSSVFDLDKENNGTSASGSVSALGLAEDMLSEGSSVQLPFSGGASESSGATMVGIGEEVVCEENNNEEELVKEAKLAADMRLSKEKMRSLESEETQRERQQQLEAEKCSRDLDRTNRDIVELQSLMKAMYRGRRSEEKKLTFYQRQIGELSTQLQKASAKKSQYESERRRVEPSDVKRMHATEVKISKEHAAIKQLRRQLQQYKEKVSQLKKLQALHREDSVKISRMNSKLQSLKQRKVYLQRQLSESKREHMRWKAEAESQMKQLRKSMREKNVQLQKHKAKLDKMLSALKQKSAALVHLQRKNREASMAKKKTEAMAAARGGGTALRTRMLLKKVDGFFDALLFKHKSASKYWTLLKQMTDIDSEIAASRASLKEVSVCLSSAVSPKEADQMRGDKLEFEQQIEDGKSAKEYVCRQLTAIETEMKAIDSALWKKLRVLRGDVAVSYSSMRRVAPLQLRCSVKELNTALRLRTMAETKAAMCHLFNGWIKSSLHYESTQKQMQHLKQRQKELSEEFGNELRKKQVLIDKYVNDWRIREEALREEIYEEMGLASGRHSRGGRHGASAHRRHIGGGIGDGNGVADDSDMLLCSPVLDEAAESERDKMATELRNTKRALSLFCSPHPSSSRRPSIRETLEKDDSPTVRTLGFDQICESWKGYKMAATSGGSVASKSTISAAAIGIGAVVDSGSGNGKEEMSPSPSLCSSAYSSDSDCEVDGGVVVASGRIKAQPRFRFDTSLATAENFHHFGGVSSTKSAAERIQFETSDLSAKDEDVAHQCLDDSDIVMTDTTTTVASKKCAPKSATTASTLRIAAHSLTTAHTQVHSTSSSSSSKPVTSATTTAAAATSGCSMAALKTERVLSARQRPAYQRLASPGAWIGSSKSRFEERMKRAAHLQQKRPQTAAAATHSSASTTIPVPSTSVLRLHSHSYSSSSASLQSTKPMPPVTFSSLSDSSTVGSSAVLGESNAEVFGRLQKRVFGDSRTPDLDRSDVFERLHATSIRHQRAQIPAPVSDGSGEDLDCSMTQLSAIGARRMADISDTCNMLAPERRLSARTLRPRAELSTQPVRVLQKPD